MIDRTRRTLLSTFIYSTAASVAPSVDARSREERFLGTWSAFLEHDDPPTRLKLVIDGDHSGHLTVIDAGEVPLRRLEISGKTLQLEIAQPPLAYRATLAGDRMTGVCRRDDQDFALDWLASTISFGWDDYFFRVFSPSLTVHRGAV